MKALLFPLLAALITLAAPLHAETPPDLRSPKSEAPRLLRILLYIPGSSRLIDYPDVEKILCCDANRISFETQDGHVILHQGPFTVIQPRTATAATSDGSKFYDVK
ncbi:MAG: hypothetical protein WCF18_16480 [Chthoniobacteraceae bacterium]